MDDPPFTSLQLCACVAQSATSPQKRANKEAEKGRCSITGQEKETRALQAKTLVFGKQIERNNETALIGLGITLVSYPYGLFWIRFS